MKKMLIVLLAMVVLGLFEYGNSFAEDWYLLTGKEDNRCTKASEAKLRWGTTSTLDQFGIHIKSPADLIKLCREWDIPYHIDEKVVNDRVVEVAVKVYNNKVFGAGSLTFYRMDQCQKIGKEKKEKLNSELTKYK
jgi:hypothetical protein